MKKIRVLVVIGTRPEAIKMAPVIIALKKDARFSCELCVTAQHREMLDQVLHIFQVEPTYDLNLMLKGQSIENIIEKAIPKLSEVYRQASPDVILVHGDTATTLCGSLSAFLHKIPIGHVEAGLRSGNLMAPWPEEGNRRIVSSISSIDFAPTELAKENLIAENKDTKSIYVTGNTIVDALLSQKKRLDLVKLQKYYHSIVEDFNPENKSYILITAHRRENFGSGIRDICLSIQNICDRKENIEFIWPVHPNPEISKVVYNLLGKNKRIHLIEPQDYDEFLYLMSISYLILSDSGGVQEEAPSLGKPVLLMRDETERPEALSSGCVTLVGSNPSTITEKTIELIDNKEKYMEMAKSVNPFGDGTAALKIADALAKKFGVVS
jgi:UDP-N-acetylglucosamine 2-epimerase (non-hydrolysing)